MFRKQTLDLLALAALLVLGSCNPDCENLTGVYFGNHPMLAEQEFLIEAANPAILQGRSVFFDNQRAETRFEPGYGLIARLPAAVTGDNVEMRIEDPDCTDFVRFSLNVQEPSFFVGNPAFIPPAPPEVIIPTPNPPIPPSINNAWISPNDTDYCIWFRVEPADSTAEKPTSFIISPHPVRDASGVERRSRELSVGQLTGCNPTEANALYHGNPVFGMIDTKSNRIEFWVDRGNRGVEEFTGHFINVTTTPYMDDRVPPCGPVWSTAKEYMMQVTSQQTGRQLLLYQQLTL